MQSNAKASAMLEQQHRAIDAGIKPVLGGAGSLAALQEALQLLRLHLFLEEEILFPMLEQHGVTMPVFVMKREHGQMWPVLAELLQACDGGADPATLRADCDELFKLLQMHNVKEEQIVYTAADDLAAKGLHEPLVETLDATVEVPPGWSCAMAPR